MTIRDRPASSLAPTVMLSILNPRRPNRPNRAAEPPASVIGKPDYHANQSVRFVITFLHMPPGRRRPRSRSMVRRLLCQERAAPRPGPSITSIRTPRDRPLIRSPPGGDVCSLRRLRLGRVLRSRLPSLIPEPLGTILGIFISQANAPFAITGLPAFPLTVASKQSVSFVITFTPASIGGVTSVLQVDGTAFNLGGAGAAPPPLPTYSFAAPAGFLTSLQQPSIGLTLASPYPIAVNGTLTLTVIPNGFSPDPAILFSNGTKTAPFTIPANTTQAVFSNGGTSIALQTGSTAGTITLTPSFQTASGVSLTPATPQTLQLVVPTAVPTLIGGAVTSRARREFHWPSAGFPTRRHLRSLPSPSRRHPVSNSLVRRALYRWPAQPRPGSRAWRPSRSEVSLSLPFHSRSAETHWPPLTGLRRRFRSAAFPLQPPTRRAHPRRWY